MWPENILTVESVNVNGTTGAGKIYGEIMIEYHGLEPVYRRTIADPETKLAGDYLTLTGPSTEVHTDWWALYVSLYDGDDDGDIAVGAINHHMIIPNCTVLNKPLYEVVEGTCGSVTVRYSVVSRAVRARLAVVIHGEGAARVYGTVVVRQFLGVENGSTAVRVFGKSAGESVLVVAGGEIPMDRCVVGVPIWSYVTVDVDFWSPGDGEVGHVIARGSVKFGGGDGFSQKMEKVNGSVGRHVEVTMCSISNDDSY